MISVTLAYTISDISDFGFVLCRCYRHRKDITHFLIAVFGRVVDANVYIIIIIASYIQELQHVNITRNSCTILFEKQQISPCTV